jgi:hypothetical protein
MTVFVISIPSRPRRSPFPLEYGVVFAFFHSYNPIPLRKSERKRNMSEDNGDTTSEAVAVSALSWIAADEKMLDRFLALTGIEAGQVRQAASEPGFLAGVLDFLLAHEPSLMAFCNETETDPEIVQRARETLLGNPGEEWFSI